MLQLLKTLFGGEDRAFGKARSARWPAVRAAHLKRFPTCEVCGRKDSRDVHHVVPFHVDNALELESSNLMTLCDGPTACHFAIGHFGNWATWNKAVRKDAETLRVSKQQNTGGK